MKVYAFKVIKSEESPPLEKILEEIREEQSLRNRIRLVNQQEFRAESIEENDDDDIWLLDFVRIRTSNGPGRVGRDSEVEGFDFEDEEGFGEETGALYDPATQYILIQYNHHGVKASAIADYLSAFNVEQRNLYTFDPKYDHDVERRLLNQGITRKLSFSIDISKMSEQDRQRGSSLSEALDYGRAAEADKLRIEISVGGERSRSLGQRALDGLNALRLIYGQNPEAVTKLEVTGKEDQNAMTEVLDVLAQRLSLSFNDLELGSDLRFPRDDRWRALQRARNGWKQLLTS